jgi:hypothetical protein
MRIRIQRFRLNTDPYLLIYEHKLETNLQQEKKLHFFVSKTTVYLSLGLHKELPYSASHFLPS